MPDFKVKADFEPAGDQAQAIEKLAEGLLQDRRKQTLKGVTGSGKTFSMAKIIERVQKPTLILSHNKTLAAQLYREFVDFFPDNAVEYFVSYYDYYQPEAYVPSKDLYIEKDSNINEEIDRMRLSTTSSLIERDDVIVVASVSCIYGLGNPTSFKNMRIPIVRGTKTGFDKISRALVSLHYDRNNDVLKRSSFRIRGDVMEIFPAYMKTLYRIELEWDEIARITRIHAVTGEVLEELERCTIYPAKHFVMPEDQIKAAVGSIKEELAERYEALTAANKLVEAQRIKSRTEYDIEMMEELGYCSGIENYSRPLSGRKEGERPAVLLDYFPEDFLTFIDESHVTLPQIGAMYEGDRSRKMNLVDFGFRLPSALDNRPLYISEFEDLTKRVIYVSATPGKKELQVSELIAEQVIRPTGLLDPPIEVRPTQGQIEDLYSEIKIRIKREERVLITTLTKKMSEDLADYLSNLGIKVRYLHSEIETIERVEILKDLRTGKIDVIIGINLLREGLDLPEVSLIAILDADKIGFLRSATALIQTIGRAARNSEGRVIMYADRESDAMREAISETERRRGIQREYNEKHGITPTSIKKAVQDILVRKKEEKKRDEKVSIDIIKGNFNVIISKERKALIAALEKEMFECAKDLEFEKAAFVRDEIEKLKKMGEL
ncbi:MAG: excinuclease ABC subunit B [Spirochaetales bacterium]|nr:excinuclease ABC subunit B [Spirochaetales bacterium]